SFSLASCRIGGGPSLDMYEVKGKVTYQGKPVDRVTMKFTPVEPDKGRDDLCVVTNGAYSTKLIAGKYKVSFEPAPGGPPVPSPPRAPSSPPLELDATRAQEKDFDLK